MKTEAGSNNNNHNKNNNTNKMDFDMYPSISGKQQDPVREVVMKYIDYFLPESEWVYRNNTNIILNAFISRALKTLLWELNYWVEDYEK